MPSDRATDELGKFAHEPHPLPARLPFVMNLNSRISLLALASLTPLLVGWAQDPADGPDPLAGLRDVFEAQGIALELEQGRVSIPAEVAVTNDLLEYLLAGPQGAAHETLLLTDVDPEMLNAALLTLGAKPGTNADWAPMDPLPSQAEIDAGVLPYEVTLPEGDGFFLYVGWREGEETYLFRIEDLVRDRFRGRTLRRHAFIYLGSQMIERGENSPEVFAAAVNGNLINVSFFREGHTLLTTARPECVDQSAWLANAWLLPPRGSEVRLIFSKSRIPMGWDSPVGLPLVTAAPDPGDGR